MITADASKTLTPANHHHIYVDHTTTNPCNHSLICRCTREWSQQRGPSRDRWSSSGPSEPPGHLYVAAEPHRTRRVISLLDGCVVPRVDVSLRAKAAREDEVRCAAPLLSLPHLLLLLLSQSATAAGVDRSNAHTGPRQECSSGGEQGGRRRRRQQGRRGCVARHPERLAPACPGRAGADPGAR